MRWLADIAALALSGIIGSIISWILRVTANVVGWLAQNLWTLLLAGGALIIAVVNKYIVKKGNNTELKEKVCSKIKMAAIINDRFTIK